MPNESEKHFMIKAFNFWASVHGLVDFLGVRIFRVIELKVSNGLRIV